MIAASKVQPNQSIAHRFPKDAWEYGLAIIRNLGDKVITEDRKITREVRNLTLVVLEPSEGWPLSGFGWDLPALEKYANQLMNPINTDFSYTYGNRLLSYPCSDLASFGSPAYVDQIRYCIRKLKDQSTTRRSIAITWIPDLDGESDEVPCLQLIEFLHRNGKLDLTAVFRSHDILRAWPANVYGLNKLLKYVAEETSMEPGSITTFSISAHIYGD